MTSRRIASAVTGVLACALVATACSSSKSGPSGDDGSHAAAGGHGPANATELTAKLRAGFATVRSVHLDSQTEVSGQKIHVSGDETIAGGKAKGVDIDTQLPGGNGDVRIVIVDGKTYAKLPASLSKSGKPWTAVTTDSKDPIIAGVASTLKSSLDVASVDQISKLATALTDVQDKGKEQVDGVDATHYVAQLDPSKVSTKIPGKEALGNKKIPVDMYVDSQGRPVRLKVHLAVSGQKVNSTIDFSKYNAPVTISAPPADQVGGA